MVFIKSRVFRVHADLSGAENLTQEHLDKACGNAGTKLPDGLTLKAVCFAFHNCQLRERPILGGARPPTAFPFKLGISKCRPRLRGDRLVTSMAGNQCLEVRCRIGLEPLFVGLFVLVSHHRSVKKLKPRRGDGGAGNQLGSQAGGDVLLPSRTPNGRLD